MLLDHARWKQQHFNSLKCLWIFSIRWNREPITYLSFHFGPALLLFFAFSHVLILLLSLSKRLQELVKNAKELVRLHLAGILTEVLYCLQELWEQRERGDRGEIRFTAGHSATVFYSLFDCFTGGSLGLVSLKSEQGTSRWSLKPVLTQIRPATDYGRVQRLEPELKLRQRVCWVFFTVTSTGQHPDVMSRWELSRMCTSL